MPHDVRAVIDSVQENLGLPPVKWPAVLLLTEDRVEELGVMDHLERVGLVCDLSTNSYVRWSPGAH